MQRSSRTTKTSNLKKILLKGPRLHTIKDPTRKIVAIYKQHKHSKQLRSFSEKFQLKSKPKQILIPSLTIPKL
jgi:hypothetical protein